jgi:ABC-2 type transport system ATP-binding protein
MSELVSVSNLVKCYGNKKVVDEVNLTVGSGQILGLVGPNGAGKTTCLQAILGLSDFTGDVDVLGYNPKKERERMLHDVAYIADVAVLPKWLKVEQALTYMAGVHPNFDRQKAVDFLAKTNINHKSKIKTLSKGMVTQVHLALILAIDAKVLILDEPTLGLDILTRRQFYTHLLEDFYNKDKCIIITTHQIEEIEHILTDVAFIQQGKIVLSDSTDNIKARFKLVTVSNEHLTQAASLKPLYTASVMGLTTMLFDQVNDDELAALGPITSPNLADVFVGMMQKEANA